VSDAEAELLDLHDRFCEGFAERRPDAVLATLADTPELVVVTSEEPLLRGRDEIGAFVERYAAGAITYSWRWDRRDVAAFDSFGCVLAVGSEIASAKDEQDSTPYRMTLVARLHAGRWALVQVHGSSPHHQ
jgi:SnoaL-like domain